MKDVLEYTKEELQEMSVEELEKLYSIADNMETRFDVYQKVNKTLINGLYGTLGNKWFSLFNEDMAAAITGNGRFFIQLLANNIENALQKMLPQEKPYIVYGDTDSVIGSTLVKTSLGDVKIEDLYEMLSGDVEVRGENNFIKHVNGETTAKSVSKNMKIQDKRINYVMKHKVKKRMFKIKHNGDEVQVTEDHSVMIVRNGELISVKPKELKNGDKIVKNDYMIKMYDDFTVEDLGIQEEWVYDIEVDDNHNFFGNNILVHNSVYYHIEPFVNMYMDKNPNLPINEYVDWADNFEKKVIQPVIKNTIDEFSKKLNAYNKEKIGAEREIIADAAVFTSKKKYYARVRDSEGTRYPESDPYIKVMGLEIIKSSTPNWSKKHLKNAIPHILDKNENELRDWLQSIKKEFIEVSLNDIAAGGGISKLDYDLKNDKGVPIGARAAIIHNDYIKQNGLTDKYTPIAAGDKCKRLYLTTPNKFNSNIIAYTNDSFVNEIDCVDYDTQFQKTFLKPLEIMVDCLNYNLEKETDTLDDW